jgi:hypothetical protein
MRRIMLLFTNAKTRFGAMATPEQKKNLALLPIPFSEPLGPTRPDPPMPYTDGQVSLGLCFSKYIYSHLVQQTEILIN